MFTVLVESVPTFWTSNQRVYVGFRSLLQTHARLFLPHPSPPTKRPESTRGRLHQLKQMAGGDIQVTFQAQTDGGNFQVTWCWEVISVQRCQSRRFCRCRSGFVRQKTTGLPRDFRRVAWVWDVWWVLAEAIKTFLLRIQGSFAHLSLFKILKGEDCSTKIFQTPSWRCSWLTMTCLCFLQRVCWVLDEKPVVKLARC